MGNPGRLLTATAKIKLQSVYSFPKSTKEVFSVHGVWQSPNMLPTMYGPWSPF